MTKRKRTDGTLWLVTSRHCVDEFTPSFREEKQGEQQVDHVATTTALLPTVPGETTLP